MEPPFGRRGRGAAPARGLLHERTAETSGWTYAHEMGRGEVQRVFHERVETWACDDVLVGKNDEQLLKQAVERGADVVFTTTPKLMPATLKAAVTWPQVKFLNCSLHMTHPYVRTYYGRIHEAKFILGAIAGSMAQDGRLGYIASYPTYGMTAGGERLCAGRPAGEPARGRICGLDGAPRQRHRARFQRKGHSHHLECGYEPACRRARALWPV